VPYAALVITTVVFDADETLLDLRPAIRGALQAVLAEMRRVTAAAAEVSILELEADWAHAFAADPQRPVAELRRAALARSLARVGLDSHLDRLLGLFFATRFALTRPYPDVLATLAVLRRSYRLGLATNGNSHADRCGLGGQFDFEVYADRDGVPKKPAAGFFSAVLAAAGAPAHAVVHVGDNLALDVTAAQSVGLRGGWLNRTGAALPPDAEPNLSIVGLLELPAALRNWE
jgi:putative hydrolase of the HAD superfamily